MSFQKTTGLEINLALYQPWGFGRGYVAIVSVFSLLQQFARIRDIQLNSLGRARAICVYTIKFRGFFC